MDAHGYRAHLFSATFIVILRWYFICYGHQRKAKYYAKNDDEKYEEIINLVIIKCLKIKTDSNHSSNGEQYYSNKWRPD